MPRYESGAFDPPAPVARVTLRAPGSGREAIDVAMLIDSGADVTLIPSRLVATPGLETEQAYQVAGFDGNTTFVASVRVTWFSSARC
jgi:hypothetical protein